MSTIITIPGRETQTIPGLNLTTSDVVASFAGDIDLGQMSATEETSGDDVVITFANRTGTKGSDITINVAGDIILNTRIDIPGRESQTIPGVVMTQDEVRAAFAGTVNLGSMNCAECAEGDTQILTFSNRTGTKGQIDILQELFRQLSADTPEVEEEVEVVNTMISVPGQPDREVRGMVLSSDMVLDAINSEDLSDDYTVEETVMGDTLHIVVMNDYEEDEVEELADTLIVIPGRDNQFVKGMVLDASMVRDSFAGSVDLSGYNVEEIESGSTLQVVFTARTGVKGA